MVYLNVSYGRELQTALLRLVIRETPCSIRRQYRTETVLLSTLHARQFAVVERTLRVVITNFGNNTNYPS
jgi:hypothetical protein